MKRKVIKTQAQLFLMLLEKIASFPSYVRRWYNKCSLNEDVLQIYKIHARNVLLFININSSFISLSKMINKKWHWTFEFLIIKFHIFRLMMKSVWYSYIKVGNLILLRGIILKQILSDKGLYCLLNHQFKQHKAR